MKKLTIKEIAEATKGKIICGDENSVVTGVKHDSRECETGDMFVAVTGENNNGHNYISQVIAAGCSALLVSETGPWLDEAEKAGTAAVLVEDTVYALGEAAKYYLSTLDVKKVAVTGSVGKTSVRDMIYYVLSEKYNCGKNLKNYNNFIGLPISVFRFDENTEAIVLEMGMDKPGEIDRLASIVKPDVAVITNIGMAHIENLGSQEGIFNAKMEVTAHLGEDSDREGVLVFADDGRFLTKERTAGAYRQVSVGYNGKSDYIISSVDEFGLEGIQFDLEYKEENRKLAVPTPGIHNAVNASLAVAVGNLLGVSFDEAASGLAKTQLTGSRLRLVNSESVSVIDDTYNASPDSMKSALKVLESSGNGKRKVAVLGDMYELGGESERQHYGVGVFSRGIDFDMLITVGDKAKYIYDGAAGGKAETAYFEKKEDFYKEMDRFIQKGDIILVKGSRGMEMEKIVEKILER